MEAVLISPYLAQGLQVCGRCRESPGLCSVALRRLPPQAALPPLLPPLPPLACAAGLTQVSWECSGETGLLSRDSPLGPVAAAPGR